MTITWTMYGVAVLMVYVALAATLARLEETKVWRLGWGLHGWMLFAALTIFGGTALLVILWAVIAITRWEGCE